MPRTVTYFTGLSGSEVISFTNEDDRPSGLTNVKKVAQRVFPLQYHELDDDTLALWQFDGNLSGIGPEASDMEVIGGRSERYGPGPVFGRKAFSSRKDRSLRASVITGSLQLTGSVTYMILFFPNEGVAPTDDSFPQAIFQNRGNNSSSALSENALVQIVYGSAPPGLRLFWESETSNISKEPNPRRLVAQRSWNHVAVSISPDGTNIKLFTNGKLIFNLSEQSAPSDGSNARPRVLGPQSNDVAQIDGYVASFKIVARQLSDNEIFKEAKRTLGDAI